MLASDLSRRFSGSLVLALLPCLLLAACGGGSSSPTEPGAPSSPLGTASVSGQVSVDATSGSLASGVGTLTAADESGSGVTVRIQGTSLATRADTGGGFRLEGVPHGNQVVVFETSQASAGVPLDGIAPRESIRLEVELEGSTAKVERLERDGGDEAEDDEGEEPDEEDEEPDDEEPEDDPVEIDLTLQLSPDTWNTEYEHSAGTVTAFVRGDGFKAVVLDSILMVGDDASVAPLAPVSASRQGEHVRARFAKDAVLDLLEEPEPGSDHEVCLELVVDGVEEVQVVCDDVRIVGSEDDEEGDEEDDEEDEEEDELDDLSLQLSPSTWNLNYSSSSGTVTAFVRGEGLSHVDLDSIELVGDDPAAEPLPASTARLEGNHVRAQFPKREVLDLLLDPEKNSQHTVAVRFTADGGAEAHELSATVKVVGKDE